MRHLCTRDSYMRRKISRSTAAIMSGNWMGPIVEEIDGTLWWGDNEKDYLLANTVLYDECDVDPLPDYLVHCCDCETMIDKIHSYTWADSCGTCGARLYLCRKCYEKRLNG